MRILVTNDDGIDAPGLKACEDIARQLSDEVWVVAPEYDQSGVSHSLSLNDPLRLREIGPRHFAVRGTPTDCVIMGARHILGEKLPDVVLSGVNKGRNVAEDVVYSGTIAGALEGTILGLPSFALSQEFSVETRDRPMWDTALKFAPDILRKVIAAGTDNVELLVGHHVSCVKKVAGGVQCWGTFDAGTGFSQVVDPRPFDVFGTDFSQMIVDTSACVLRRSDSSVAMIWPSRSFNCISRKRLKPMLVSSSHWKVARGISAIRLSRSAVAS